MSKRTRPAACHPDRRHWAHELCKPCYDAAYHEAHRDAHNAIARTWAENNPARRLAIRRKYLYGVTEVEVQAAYDAQHGLCAICQDRPATDVDHSHTEKVMRGLLCGNCNRGLGLFRDDPALLRNAADYLRGGYG